MLTCWLMTFFVTPMILWVLSITPDQRPFVVGVYSLMLLFALVFYNFGSYLFNPHEDDDTGVGVYSEEMLDVLAGVRHPGHAPTTRIHNHNRVATADGTTDIAALSIAI